MTRASGSGVRFASSKRSTPRCVRRTGLRAARPAATRSYQDTTTLADGTTITNITEQCAEPAALALGEAL
jgi:hypothetical protein